MLRPEGSPSAPLGTSKRGKPSPESFPRASNGGAEGIRTPDLLTASQARSQLRHSPAKNFLTLRGPICQGERWRRTPHEFP